MDAVPQHIGLSFMVELELQKTSSEDSRTFKTCGTKKSISVITLPPPGKKSFHQPINQPMAVLEMLSRLLQKLWKMAWGSQAQEKWLQWRYYALLHLWTRSIAFKKFGGVLGGGVGGGLGGGITSWSLNIPGVWNCWTRVTNNFRLQEY